MKLPTLWSTQLSFGFTVKRRLGLCVSQLQNESRRLGRSQYARISSVDQGLFEFEIEKSGLFYSSKVIGHFCYVEEDSTLVSGELKQKAFSMSGIFLALLLFMSLIAIAIASQWGIIGVLLDLFFTAIFVACSFVAIYSLIEKHESRMFLRDIQKMLAEEQLEPLHKKPLMKL